MIRVSTITVGLLLTFVSERGITEAVFCNSCHNVGSPKHCRDVMVCGKDEICFTREYVDNRNRQAFHLGCEDASRCKLFENPLFGKREAPKKCYKCCSDGECNNNLCLETLDTASAGNITHCPKLFVGFLSHCYLFAPGTANWLTARDYCRSFGAELLSMTTMQEHAFIRTQLVSLKASHTGNFWTGGVYSHAAGEFEWMDGSHFNFTHWYSGQPPDTFNHTLNYYIAMGNPAYAAFYADAPAWVDADGDGEFGIICKT